MTRVLEILSRPMESVLIENGAADLQKEKKIVG